MARRRKSNSSNKTRESKERSASEEPAAQEEEGEDINLCEQETTESLNRQLHSDGKEEQNNKVSEVYEQSQDKMMPLDIQQMILGDLQSVGQGEEIIVSRENAGDCMEEEMDEEMVEPVAVLESPREEEYENQTEEDEEEELVFMNEEDEGEENQYVIVVNSDYEANDGADQEVVSIHNLTDLQEGSCEIITVVRESDYDSSQESLDEMEEEGCDNINAVIGTVDGIHCVKISQYNSEDESSNHDESFEKEIKVTEHETEVACIPSIGSNIGHTVQMSEDRDIKTFINDEQQMEQDCSEFTINNSVATSEHTESHSKNISKLVQEEVGSNSVNSGLKSNCNQISSQTVGLSEESGYSKSSNNKPYTRNKETKSNDIELTTKLIGDHLKMTSLEAAHTKQITCNTNLDDSESEGIVKKIQNNNSVETNKTRITPHSSNEKVEDKNIQEQITSEDSASLSKDNSDAVDINDTTNIGKHLEFPKNAKDITLALKKEKISQSVQEDKVTSNCNINDNTQSDVLHTIDIASNSVKKEELNSSFVNSLVETTCNLEEKIDISKEEEGKQNVFRSRSGSTDTTGSESGSNSSFSRRRSGRIKLISVSKYAETEAGYKSTNSNSVAVVTSTTTPPVPGYELDKPVKVKSRWRRSSELEMVSGNKRQHEGDVNLINRTADTTLARSGQPSTPPDSPPSDKEVEDVVNSFQRLDSNEYHTDRSRSKEAKRMVCDCTLTKEELARGDMGCGEDCLNRLLMIECGARCMLGERCANKRFQNLEYAKCEVFKTEMKGYGLRALEDIPEDTFLLEYVGEVLDPKEFRRRAKDYAKDKILHFYFMALKSDSIIDATQKGNISRFINHSCDPNAETQKWTVNGELRVGFFSKRPIAAGEEITFDYKYQRYGKEAQRCYCNSTSCRGWIGEDPEKENKWSDVKSRNKDRREKKKKEDKRTVKDVLNDIDLEEEVEKLVLKNRAQTLMLCRLIVRAEDHQSRMQLLNILQKGETACQRLFLDYHGLRLIWSWMMDPACDTGLKIEILETLFKLPIPNKTMLQDSRVLGVVEKWSTTALKISEAKDRSSTEDDSDKTDHEKDKQVKGSESSDDSNTNKFVEPEDVQERNKKKIIELANDLLKEWSSLKEVFRIPKKERIEQMKEHEREADKVCRDSLGKHDKSHDKQYSQDKHRNDYERRDRDKDRDRKRGRDSPDSDRSKRASKLDDRQSQMSKTERRQLFAIKVAQEEEERQRRQQECRWQEQVQLAAQELAQAQAQAQQEMEINYPPSQHPWMSYPPGNPNGMPPQHMDGQPMFGNLSHINTPPFLFNQGPHMHQHPPFLDPIHTPPFHNPVFNQPPPLPKQPLLPTPHQHPLLPTPPLPNQPLQHTPPLPNQPPGQQHLLQPLLPTPPLPNQPPVHQNIQQSLLPTPPLPNQTLGQQHLHQPLLPTPPLPNQPPGQQHLHQPLLPTTPLPNQPPGLQNLKQPLLSTPPLPNQPYPQNQPLLPTPPLPNQPYPNQTLMPNPHSMGLSHFTTQPPLPNVPAPLAITSQPPPSTPITFPQDGISQFNFQSPLALPQNQFSQPPPFNAQPPLPTLPPTPCPKPVIPVTSTVTQVPILLPAPTPVRLPPKWKTANDGEGRTYYYHVKTRISQWEPPLWDYQKQKEQVSESESDSSDSSDDDSSSEEEEQEEEKMDDEEPEPVEEVVQEEDLGCEELGDSPYEPETMEMFEDIVEDTKKRSLVQERIISPRTAEEMPDKLDKRKIRELKEKLRRQKAKEKIRQKQKNKLKGRSGTSKCEADTSSDPGRKIKDAFRLNMAGVIVHYLNAYRKPDCKFGKITNTEDFKHLARKLTHFVMVKELKHCRSVDELNCNDNVKHKARDFIKKYMAKFGSVYQRRDDD